jgi:hypothetical protein
VIFVLARRSLFAHPVRSAVLAGGFGLGVAVMASLLGIGEVILAQARAPALRGGGDVVIVGGTGPVGSARFVLASVLGTPPLASRVAAAAPIQRRALFLVRGGRVVPIRARGGVPSLDRRMGDRETSAIAAWTDTPADAAWAAPEAGAVLRAMDRFHPIPDVPARAASWAEWLYFNGRVGDTRFYLTFLVGPARAAGQRAAGVRFQLEEGGRMRSFSEGGEVDAARVLADAPDLAIGKSRVRLDGRLYRVSLDLPSDGGGSGRVAGELVLEGLPGRSMPPFTIGGAGGWVSGYVVPVMSGPLTGGLTVDGRRVTLDGGSGYHDHNWGFWEGVTWQWGHVQHDDLSFVYGRVHPPADAADADRLPGFLGVLGRDGPIGYSTNVTIEETSDPGSARPRRIVVKGRGPSLAVTMALDVEQAVTTRMPPRAFGGGMDFYQLRARYRVSGQAGDRRIDFEAPGAAETFRGAPRPPD